MRKLTLAAGIAALVVTSACKKTGEGEYQVEKPTVGTTTDTVETPSRRDRHRQGHAERAQGDDREEGSGRPQGGREDA